MESDPGTIRDYRDLIVWREAMDIAEQVYVLTRSYPRDEAFGLAAQMRRAAVSIPSNIAEGFGRAQRRAFVQFLRIAQGSLKELETQAILSGRIGYISPHELERLMHDCQRLGKRLVAFVRSLRVGEE